MKRTRGPSRFTGLSPLLLFAVSLAWRLAYLSRLRHASVIDTLNGDAHIYWTWSEFIARHGPVPPAPFFLAPLYPYFLSVVHLLGTDGVGFVLVVQAVLGAAAVVLLSSAAARVGGRWAGIATFALVAFGQAPTFFDALILPESLLFFVESVLVALVVGTDWTAARLRSFAWYGILAGVLALGRASHGVVLLLVVPLARTAFPELRARLRAILTAALACAACIVPSTIATLLASGEVIPLTYNLGFNLAVGFNPEADGTYVDVTAGSLSVPLEGTSPTTGGALDGRAYLLASTGERLGASASSGAWTARAAAFARAHPLRALELMTSKVVLAWNRRALPQIESIASMERLAGPVGIPVLGGFGFTAFLGLAALPWAVRGSVVERWAAGYVLLMSLALTPFFVTDRYRHHLVPALAVLAGVAVVRAVGVIRSGTRSERLRAAVAASCAGAIVLYPIAPRDARLEGWAPEADAAIRLAEAGRSVEAVTAFARAEQRLPPAFPDGFSTSARTAVASFSLRHGIALQSVGREEDAVARWERAVRMNPNDAASLARLRIAYARSGRTADEAKVRRRLRTVPGGRGLELLNDGWIAAGRGDLAAAEEAFVAAVRVSPDLTMAWEGLIRLRIQGARYGEAEQGLAAARDVGLNRFSAGVYESYLAATRGDIAAARRAVVRIPEGPPTADATLLRLLEEARRMIER